jgi:formamidopyrimidine-DNA glycosylase
MPELPEVETTRRSIEPILERRRIVAVGLGRDRVLRRQPVPELFAPRVEGNTVSAVGRLGKFLDISLVDGISLVIHLGMSGRIEHHPNVDAPLMSHTQLVLTTDRGEQLRFVDPRTFGFAAALDEDERHLIFANIGRDAFTDLPGPIELRRAWGRSRSPMKALLLDQRVVAGIGNIYADEILHRARIHPQLRGDQLTPRRTSAIHEAIGDVLTDGLRWGGTSLNDLAYLLPDGRAGEFTSRLAVYGKTDMPCDVCGRPIHQITVRQRSTHFCGRCQRLRQ